MYRICVSGRRRAASLPPEKGRPIPFGKIFISRYLFGVYVHSYTRHSTTEEVLDDGLSGIQAEVAIGTRTRSRPEPDPAPLIRGGSALQETVSPELTLPGGAKGLEQASNESPHDERDELRALLEHEISANTRRNYLSQWKRFQEWAELKEVESRPADPEHIAIYLNEREGNGDAPATLKASATAISHMHRIVGIPYDPCSTPLVRRTLRAATRKASEDGREQKQAYPLKEEAFKAIQNTACMPRTGKGGSLERAETALKRGKLDIAMIGMMRDGLLRVSEASNVVWTDIEGRLDGSGRLMIRRSKTDREGKGFVTYLSVRTMSALNEIRNGASDAHRVIGLRPNQIGKRISKAARQAGLGNAFSGHSCRVGMACDLASEGIDHPKIMHAGRWRSVEMVAHYTRSETAARNAVAEYYGYRYRLD